MCFLAKHTTNRIICRVPFVCRVLLFGHTANDLFAVCPFCFLAHGKRETQVKLAVSRRGGSGGADGGGAGAPGAVPGLPRQAGVCPSPDGILMPLLAT